MQRVTLTATACLFAALAMLAGSHAGAQETNTTERTFMSFTSSVELPGVTLEPGTYEFRLADNASRDVVQVFRKDSRDPMGQWTFVPSSRPRASDETVVMFRETREGATPAIQLWYFPGETIGKEFVYPKEQAERIASRTGQTVQSEDGPVTAATARADADAAAPADSGAQASARDASDADALLRDAPAAAQPTAPAGSTTGSRGVDTPQSDRAERVDPDADAAGDAEPAQVAQSSQPAQPARAESPRPVGTSGSADANQQPAREASQVASELPRTASPLPLVGLFGLLSLGGAAALRALRR